MAYKNSRIGEFIDPKAQSSNRDSISLLETRSIKKDFATIYFGNNTKNKGERDEGTFVSSVMAEANVIEDEISPINKLIKSKASNISVGIRGKGLSVEDNQVSVIEYVSKSEDNLAFWKSGLSGGGSGDEIALPSIIEYAIVMGRALDRMDKNMKRTVVPFDFGVSESFKISIPLRVSVRSDHGRFKIVVPKIPVYSKIVTGTFGSRRDNKNDHVIAPVPHMIFPVLYDVFCNDLSVKMTLPATSSDISGDTSQVTRIYFESTSNGRESLGVITREPFKTDIIGNNFVDVKHNNDDEPICGLDTTALNDLYGHGEELSPFGDKNQFTPLDISYGKFTDVPLTEGVGAFSLIDEYFKPPVGVYNEAQEILQRSDAKFLNFHCYKGQRVLYSEDILLSEYYGMESTGTVGDKGEYILEIEYSVSIVSQSANTLLCDTDNQAVPPGVNILDNTLDSSRRFYYEGDQVVALIPETAKLKWTECHAHPDPDTYSEETLKEGPVNMIISTPQRNVVPFNAPFAKSLQNVSDIYFAPKGKAKAMLLYLSKDNKESIVGYPAVEKIGNIYYVSIFPVYDNKDRAYFSKTSIPLFEMDTPPGEDNLEWTGWSLLLSEFNLLYDSHPDKSIYCKMSFTKDEDTDPVDIEVVFSLSSLERFPYAMLSKTKIENDILFTTRPYINGIIEEESRKRAINSKFCNNSYGFSGVIFGDYRADAYFRQKCAYTLYQRYAVNSEGEILNKYFVNNNNSDRYVVGGSEYLYKHLEKTTPAFFQQVPLKLLIGDSCFCRKISLGNVLLTVGNTNLLFLQDYYYEGLAGYMTGSGVANTVSSEIIPIVYPVPVLFKDRSFEHTYIKTNMKKGNLHSTPNSLNELHYKYDISTRGFTASGLSTMFKYLTTHTHFGPYDIPVFEFLVNMRISNYSYSHFTTHFLAIDVDDTFSWSNLVSSIPASMAGVLREDGFTELYTPTTGTLIISKSPRLIEGGAMESIDDVVSFAGMDLFNGKLFYSASNVELFGQSLLVYKDNVYKRPNMFINTSSLSERVSSNSLDIKAKQFNSPPYLITYSNDQGFNIIYSDRNEQSQIYSSQGTMIDSPSSVNENICFQYVFDRKLYFCTLVNKEVYITSILNLPDLFPASSTTTFDISKWMFFCFAVKNNDKPIFLISKRDDEGVSVLYYTISPYGIINVNAEVSFISIVMTTYLGSQGLPLLIDSDMFASEITQVFYTSDNLPVFKIKTSVTDISYGLDAYFIPVGLEVFFRPYDSEFSGQGGSINIVMRDATNNEIISSQDKTIAFDNGKSRHIMNFVLDINTINSFYFEVECTNMIARNISLHGYLINKD